MTIAELRTLLPAGGPLVLKTLGGQASFDVMKLEGAQLVIRNSKGHMFELTQKSLDAVEVRIREVKGQRITSLYCDGNRPENWKLGYRSPAQCAASLTPSLAPVRPAEPGLPSARDGQPASVVTTSTNRPDQL